MKFFVTYEIDIDTKKTSLVEFAHVLRTAQETFVKAVAPLGPCKRVASGEPFGLTTKPPTEAK